MNGMVMVEERTFRRLVSALEMATAALDEVAATQGRQKKVVYQPVVKLDTPVETKNWEIHVPGVTGKTTDLPEKMTVSEKNIRLSQGWFKTGTLLRHPKAGWQRVTGEQGSGQGMEPIEAQAAIALLDA